MRVVQINPVINTDHQEHTARPSTIGWVGSVEAAVWQESVARSMPGNELWHPVVLMDINEIHIDVYWGTPGSCIDVDADPNTIYGMYCQLIELFWLETSEEYPF